MAPEYCINATSQNVLLKSPFNRVNTVPIFVIDRANVFPQLFGYCVEESSKSRDDGGHLQIAT